MDIKITKIKKIKDSRGDLIVYLKKEALKNYKHFGQIYLVTFSKKGVVRANHYHKKTREWIGIISGKLSVELTDIKTGNIKKIILDSKSKIFLRLEVGQLINHKLTSLSQNAIIVSYSDKEWSVDDEFIMKT